MSVSLCARTRAPSSPWLLRARVVLPVSRPPISDGAVLIAGRRIAAVGRWHELASGRRKETLDLGDALLMPGLINAHHHLYSTFARGFVPPGRAPVNFREVLEFLWWKLDLALDMADVYHSALLSLVECIKLGCTTVIDHHASPSCRNGSLDTIENAFRHAGLNGCLCYEVSDRNREAAGIEENLRFIEKCAASSDGQSAALFGLHASMTLETKTLDQCAEIAEDKKIGFHVHAAEDEIDQHVTQAEFGHFDILRSAGVMAIPACASICAARS